MKTVLIKGNKINKVIDSFEDKTKDNADEIIYIMSKSEFEDYRENLQCNVPYLKTDTPMNINKIEVYEDYTYIKMSATITEQLDISFYIKDDILVIITDIDSIDEMKKIIDGITFNVSIAKTIYGIMNERFKESYNDLTHIENELAELESFLIKQDDEEPNYVREIIRQRKRLSTHQKDYDQLALVIDDVNDNENKIFTKNELIYFDNLNKSIARINSNIRYQMDYLSQIREAYESFTDIKLNNTMKVLTVVTAVFLPLTLIVGWFGMNFETMPELAWEYGYIYVIVLSLLTVAGCVYLIKKKKWL